MATEKVGLITCRDLPDLTPDDQLLIEPLANARLSAVPLVWDDERVRWEEFDCLVVRSCWDYSEKVDRFRSWLERMESLQVRIWNPVSVVRWNLDKTYLWQLQGQGVSLPETIFLDRRGQENLSDLLGAIHLEEVVIKPTISASSRNTYRVTRETAAQHQPNLERILRSGDAMVQEFVPEILSTGEWSLLFYGGEFSHAVVKVPEPGEFRVQAEFGGKYLKSDPPGWLIKRASEILGLVKEPILHARVDGVVRGGRFLLLELELIEPELLFRHDPQAPARFVRALLEK